jgi:choice-of-anchor B domain-containing protein
MKVLTITLLLFIGFFSAGAQLNMSQIGNLNYNNSLSDVWGYVDSNGIEYAIVGVENGVSIVSLSDPENPVELFFLNGINSIWRDIIVWGDYAYVSNESANGLMVINLGQLPEDVSSFNWGPNISGVGILNSIHNFYIDEFGIAYIAGSNLNGGGMLYVDVNTTPGSPVYIGKGPAIYSHDVYVRDNKMYSSEINAGVFSIYDVSDKSNTVLLGNQSTAFNFTHNSWLSDDGNTLFTTDEKGNAPIGSYDVSDPQNIEELDQFVPLETVGQGVIPHNAHVLNDYIIVSYYTDGCVIIDGSNPSNLVEVANFDTYLPDNNGFNGAWGAYPFLPSGLILISDIESGLFVLEPNYVRACWLEGNIMRADDNTPLFDAFIEILSTNVIDRSNLFGNYTTGFATAGSYEVVISKPGFVSDTVSVILQNDSTSYVNAELTPLPSFMVSGIVNDNETGEPIANARVIIRNDFFTFDHETAPDGSFVINEFFEGNYEIHIGKWGYVTMSAEGENIGENNNVFNVSLESGYEDNFSLGLGWIATNTANQGDWERGKPIGVQPNGFPFYLAPDEDVSEDDGNSCYVTGNTSDINNGVVIGGNARITSPEFDLSGFENPSISFYTWYFNFNINTNQAANNKLKVRISNGQQIKTVTNITYDELAEIEWEYFTFDVASIIDPTETMTIYFEAQTPGDFSTVSEAGLDNFKIYEGNPTGIDDVAVNELILTAAPNPSSNVFTINYNIRENDDNVMLRIYNISGQLVNEVVINGNEGSIKIGEELNRGMYIVQLSSNNVTLKSIRLIKN